MPDGRFISKSISVSEQVGNVSLEADFLFGRCIPHLDVDGRIVGNPKTLKATVCPLRDELTSQKIYRLLAELHAAGLVVWYEVNGLRFLEFPTFPRHQKGMHRDREAISKIPSSQDEAAQPVTGESGVGPDEVRMKSADSAELVRLSKEKLSEVKESEVKIADSGESGSRVSRFPTEICQRLHDTATKTGHVTEYPRFRKALLALYPASGPLYQEPEIAEGLKAFYESADGMTPKDAQFQTIERFVQGVGRWVALGKMPLANENGVTERGRLAVGVR